MTLTYKQITFLLCTEEGRTWTPKHKSQQDIRNSLTYWTRNNSIILLHLPDQNRELSNDTHMRVEGGPAKSSQESIACPQKAF